MPRAANISYRAGGFDAEPFISVKNGGRFVYIGSAPKWDVHRIAFAVQDLEDGCEDVSAAWGLGDNDVPRRVYEQLHRDSAEDLEALGVRRADLGVLATFAFYPESYEAMREQQRMMKMLDDLLSIGSIVRSLDERYWAREAIVADGVLSVPVPPLREDKLNIWMFNDILNHGRRFPKRAERSRW